MDGRVAQTLTLTLTLTLILTLTLTLTLALALSAPPAAGGLSRSSIAFKEAWRRACLRYVTWLSSLLT